MFSAYFSNFREVGTFLLSSEGEEGEADHEEHDRDHAEDERSFHVAVSVLALLLCASLGVNLLMSGKMRLSQARHRGVVWPQESSGRGLRFPAGNSIPGRDYRDTLNTFRQ